MPRLPDDGAECPAGIAGAHGVSWRWRGRQHVANLDVPVLGVDVTEDLAQKRER
jgi:hypothetical protein